MEILNLFEITVEVSILILFIGIVRKLLKKFINPNLRYRCSVTGRCIGHTACGREWDSRRQREAGGLFCTGYRSEIGY